MKAGVSKGQGRGAGIWLVECVVAAAVAASHEAEGMLLAGGV